MTKTAKQGFTLIELLVVISIIGILATLITANLNAARSRARDAARKSDLKNLQTALRIYYNDQGAYPVSLPAVGSPLTSTTGSSIYMNAVPGDPLPEQTYAYSRPDADTFVISACLENQSDTSCKTLTVPGWTCSTGCVYQLMP